MTIILLALLLQHRQGPAARQHRGDHGTGAGPHGAQHQIAGQSDHDDHGDGRGRHRQQEARPLRCTSPAGTPPPVLCKAVLSVGRARRAGCPVGGPLRGRAARRDGGGPIAQAIPWLLPK